MTETSLQMRIHFKIHTIKLWWRRLLLHSTQLIHWTTFPFHTAPPTSHSIKHNPIHTQPPHLHSHHIPTPTNPPTWSPTSPQFPLPPSWTPPPWWSLTLQNWRYQALPCGLHGDKERETYWHANRHPWMIMSCLKSVLCTIWIEAC